MNYLAFILDIFLNSFTYLLRRDIIVLADAPDKSLFDFERWQHGRQGCEYFGLGLHVIVSPLEMPVHSRD
jgi:hypothetical protein